MSAPWYDEFELSWFKLEWFDDDFPTLFVCDDEIGTEYERADKDLGLNLVEINAILGRRIEELDK